MRTIYMFRCAKCRHDWATHFNHVITFGGTESQKRQWEHQNHRKWEHCYCGLPIQNSLFKLEAVTTL